MATNNYDMYRGVYVRTGNKRVIEKAFSGGFITSEEYTKILGTDAPVEPLALKKAKKIAESKAALAKYIEEHPLSSNCHGGKTAVYTVTEEKQNMFNRKFMAHTALVTAGIPDVMTWNAAGQPCEEWTDAECLQFITEMNAYVTALVSYQQHLEVKISACADEAALDSIDIDFSSVVTASLPS